jgi:hypothetical protein
METRIGEPQVGGIPDLVSQGRLIQDPADSVFPGPPWTGAPSSQQRTWADNDFFQMLSLQVSTWPLPVSNSPFARIVGALEGLRPVFFVPCTLVRTWGTRLRRSGNGILTWTSLNLSRPCGTESGILGPAVRVFSRKLFPPQCLHGINRGGTERRKGRCGQSQQQHATCGNRQHQRVERAHAEEQRAQQA